MKLQAFKVKDCTIIERAAGVDPAMNLRELRERVTVCSIECLYYHYCETLIRPSFDDPEFRNDFAVWAAYQLRDRVLAERLGIINPYTYDDLEQLREKTVEIIDERLSEVDHIPWVPKREVFRFMQAVTVIFDTGIELHHPEELVQKLPLMSNSTIYYHLLEARRRTPKKTDDFTAWLVDLKEDTSAMLAVLAHIDFYFLSLSELKQALIEALRSIAGRSNRSVQKP